MKYTHFHFTLKNLAQNLQKEINRCLYFCDKYPDDPRFEENIKQLNIYRCLLNIIVGNEDVTMSQELWDYMTQSYQESLGIKDKFIPIQSEISNVPDVKVPQFVNAPEVEEVVEEKPKSKKKVKS